MINGIKDIRTDLISTEFEEVERLDTQDCFATRRGGLRQTDTQT